MYKIYHSVEISHRVENIFQLVNDVSSYQDFLPWCGGSKEIERTDTVVLASVIIAFKGFKKAFTTRNIMFINEKIVLELIEGPFSKLSGEWSFQKTGENSCNVSLKLDFDFPSRIMGKLLGPIFYGIASSMVHSFCKRADEIYPDHGLTNN